MVHAERLLVGQERRLRGDEKRLVSFLLERLSSPLKAKEALGELRVCTMNDGRMGSLRFVSDKADRHRAGALAEAQFKDADGVLVDLELSVDQYGDLFELDLWKVDFSPLVRIAETEDINIKPTTAGRKPRS